MKTHALLLSLATACFLIAQPAASSEVTCVARTVWLEARGEPLAGQRAVAHVIVNRKKAKGWPGNACAVVAQKGQFARGPVRTTESASWKRAMKVAREALQGVSGDPTDGATYFYAHRKVKPSWARKFRTTTVIGNHTFKRRR